jgi:transposase
MPETARYIGLDVHKASISVSVAEEGRDGEVRFIGTIANTSLDVAKLARRLAKEGHRLELCYEAGPCGYGLYRQLTKLGHSCTVVAPSLIPTRPGDRIKTDRRDSQRLAMLHRFGKLTAVWVPDAMHEAMRDLVRARIHAAMQLMRAREDPALDEWLKCLIDAADALADQPEPAATVAEAAIGSCGKYEVAFDEASRRSGGLAYEGIERIKKDAIVPKVLAQVMAVRAVRAKLRKEAPSPTPAINYNHM